MEIKNYSRIVQDDNFVVLLDAETGVEILHKERNYSSEILKEGEQIDGDPHQAILLRPSIQIKKINAFNL